VITLTLIPFTPNPFTLIPFALIWILLAVSLVVVLVLTGIRLVRGFLRVLTALSDLAVTTAVLDNVSPTRELERARPSILAPFPEVVTHVIARSDARRERKQARHQRRLERAYQITHVDVASREWFAAPGAGAGAGAGARAGARADITTGRSSANSSTGIN
jgi:hypothetical protein